MHSWDRQRSLWRVRVDSGNSRSGVDSKKMPISTGHSSLVYSFQGQRPRQARGPCVYFDRPKRVDWCLGALRLTINSFIRRGAFRTGVSTYGTRNLYWAGSPWKYKRTFVHGGISRTCGQLGLVYHDYPKLRYPIQTIAFRPGHLSIL
jgi:hypothetical protein